MTGNAELDPLTTQNKASNRGRWVNRLQRFQLGAVGDELKGLKFPAPRVNGTMRQGVNPPKAGLARRKQSTAPFNTPRPRYD